MLLELLISFTNAQTLHIEPPLGLDRGISDIFNQIILSCIEAMRKLNTIELIAWHLADPQQHPCIAFLNVAPASLKHVKIGPFWSLDTSYGETTRGNEVVVPAPVPNSSLLSLAIHAQRVPLSGFYPWTNQLRSLRLFALTLPDGNDNHYQSIKETMFPVSSTLRMLNLSISKSSRVPTLDDLNMAYCPNLSSFTYEGPWFISRSADTAFDVCTALFPRAYETFNLHMEPYADGPAATVRSVKILREAFTLAHERGHSPVASNIVLNMHKAHDFDYTLTRIVNVRYEIGYLLEDLHDRGVRRAEFEDDTLSTEHREKVLYGWGSDDEDHYLGGASDLSDDSEYEEAEEDEE